MSTSSKWEEYAAFISFRQQFANAAASRVTDAVQQAREAGIPWSVIGEALGVSKQSAWERYGKAPATPVHPDDVPLPGMFS